MQNYDIINCQILYKTNYKIKEVNNLKIFQL